MHIGYSMTERQIIEEHTNRILNSSDFINQITPLFNKYSKTTDYQASEVAANIVFIRRYIYIYIYIYIEA